MNVKRVLLIVAAFVSVGAALAADPAANAKKVLVISRIEGFNHKASVAACKEKMAEEAKKGLTQGEADLAAIRQICKV